MKATGYVAMVLLGIACAAAGPLAGRIDRDAREAGRIEGDRAARAELEVHIEEMRQECIQRGRECGEMQQERCILDCLPICDALAMDR